MALRRELRVQGRGVSDDVHDRCGVRAGLELRGRRVRREDGLVVEWCRRRERVLVIERSRRSERFLEQRFLEQRGRDERRGWSSGVVVEQRVVE